MHYYTQSWFNRIDEFSPYYRVCTCRVIQRYNIITSYVININKRWIQSLVGGKGFQLLVHVKKNVYIYIYKTNPHGNLNPTELRGKFART